jgi:hypothetical protein
LGCQDTDPLDRFLKQLLPVNGCDLAMGKARP